MEKIRSLTISKFPIFSTILLKASFLKRDILSDNEKKFDSLYL